MISRSIHRSLAAIALAILCAFPFASSFYTEHRWNVDRPAIGEKVRPFTMTFAGGRTFVFESTRAKKLLLIFFSMSCPHCRTEINNFNSLSRIYSTKLDVVGVCVDSTLSFDDKRDITAPSFPVVFEKGIDLAQNFRVTGVPSAFYIDEGRVLRARSSGEQSFHSDSLNIASFVDLP